MILKFCLVSLVVLTTRSLDANTFPLTVQYEGRTIFGEFEQSPGNLVILDNFEPFVLDFTVSSPQLVFEDEFFTHYQVIGRGSLHVAGRTFDTRTSQFDLFLNDMGPLDFLSSDFVITHFPPVGQDISNLAEMIEYLDVGESDGVIDLFPEFFGNPSLVFFTGEFQSHRIVPEPGFGLSGLIVFIALLRCKRIRGERAVYL